jgi:hypothetical protein
MMMMMTTTTMMMIFIFFFVFLVMFSFFSLLSVFFFHMSFFFLFLDGLLGLLLVLVLLVFVAAVAVDVATSSYSSGSGTGRSSRSGDEIVLTVMDGPGWRCLCCRVKKILPGASFKSGAVATVGRIHWCHAEIWTSSQQWHPRALPFGDGKPYLGKDSVVTNICQHLPTLKSDWSIWSAEITSVNTKDIDHFESLITERRVEIRDSTNSWGFDTIQQEKALRSETASDSTSFGNSVVNYKCQLKK